ncbi:MAG: hypothetical protein FJ280_03100 [Planctomycetes bacterium]|nr:hypothetical protein [Planctomycetota bacterium]
MTGQLCSACEHFAPAHTCIERPTWGHCMKLIGAKPGWSTQKLRPFFTWADNRCDDFQARQAPVVRR